MKNVLKPLAKRVLVPLGLTTADVAIQIQLIKKRMVS